MATYYWVGGTGTWSVTGNTQFAITSGGAATLLDPTSADTVIIDDNSGAGTVTTASGVVVTQMNLNSTNTILQLGADLFCSSQFSHTKGTLDLNDFAFSVGIFSGSNANTRAIAFGSTGQINVTANNAVVWLASDLTNFSFTGTSRVNFTYSGSTGTRTLRHGFTAGGSETSSLNFYVTAGTDTVTFTSTSYVRTLDFTGFAGTYTTATIFVYGNYIISSGMSVSTASVTTNFAATSGTQQITTNGKTLNFFITQNGVGGTVQLQDNLTMGSTRVYTLTNGALDLNNQTLSTGRFSSSNSNVRSIAFGTGNIDLTGDSATIWNTTTSTGLTVTGTPVVNCTYAGGTGTRAIVGATTEATAISFNFTAGTDTVSTGSGFSYKNLDFTGFSGTLSNNVRNIYGNLIISSGMTLTAGANSLRFYGTSGTQLITTAGKTFDFPMVFNGIGGTFAFQDALTQGSTMAFTVTNGTVQLKDGVTSTVGSFATSGTNQKYLQSTTAGSQATLSQASGTVGVSYLTIQDINATGGATWNSFYANNNVDAGNNTNWNFGGTPSYDAEYGYKLRSFTEHGRF